MKKALKQIAVVLGGASFVLGILIAGGADYNNDMNWGQLLLGVAMVAIPGLIYIHNNKE